MIDFSILNDWMKKLDENGHPTVQLHLISTEKHEMTSENGKVSMLRTMFNTSFTIKSIKDGRSAKISRSSIDSSSFCDVCSTLNNKLADAPVGKETEIAPFQPHETFSNEILKADMGALYDRFEEYLDEIYRKNSTLTEKSIISFEKNHSRLINSNGVDFNEEYGRYNFVSSISFRDGFNVGSGNFAQIAMADLGRPLIETGCYRDILKQALDQPQAIDLKQNFEGDVIISPYFVGWLVWVMNQLWLGDRQTEKAAGGFAEKLGQKVASNLFNLHSQCTDPTLAARQYLTSEGYRAENEWVIRDGVLNSLLIGAHTANKMNLPRSGNQGAFFVVDPGTTPFADMAKQIKQGLLVNRIAGGLPTINGDFSVLAKNSYYIEDGEVKYPVNDVFISGNILDMLRKINAISKEYINFGNALFPSISFSNIKVRSS
ncbi:MAG: metallopeptidase TldD-related protein [Candidatus Riflebacteria bacterium]